MTDDISTLIGILVDVSGSMRANVDDRVSVDKESNTWVKSVIQVIDDLIKYDVSSSNHMFAVGVGTTCGNDGIFDVMSTIQQFQSTSTLKYEYVFYEEKIDRILEILESNGAKYVRKWADINIIRKAASDNMVDLILRQLESNRKFVDAFVNDFLPKVCTEGIKHKKLASAGIGTGAGIGLLAVAGLCPLALFAAPVLVAATAVGVNETAESAIGAVRPATNEEVKEVLQKAKNFLLKKVSHNSSFFSVREAHKIIHGCVDNEDLSEKRRKELLNAVEPYIFGLTPMYKALDTTTELFGNKNYSGHKKLLLIFSDGLPSDFEDMESLKLKDANIWVVSCFITKTDIEPKRLYCEVDTSWDDGAAFLFDLSSKVPTQLLPRTIFVKQGWKIDIENNETRLFLQVNHPDHIKGACDLARNVVCCQDALADILTYATLDIYISQYASRYPAHNQDGDTYYANASAAVLHLSMKRILGRKNGYPSFDDLREDIITRYRNNVSFNSTLSILKVVCPLYRLHCQNVDIKGALCAITAKRPVVATFRLTQREWVAFSEFYNKNKSGILSRKNIDINARKSNEKLTGHAVVLTSYNSECLRFMNSWGIDWGDNGFFRVQNTDVLDFKYIDVFWTNDDLHQEEKDYYASHGSRMASKLFNTLKGLQSAKYRCPLCGMTSLVTDFSGTLLQAKCPQCLRNFKSDENGNILALNIYLTSLSR